MRRAQERVVSSGARTERAEMGDEKKGRRKKPEASQAAELPVKTDERPLTKAELVGSVIKNIEEKLKRNELKPTVGDFIRLVQLKKELDEEQPREIEVSWVEPAQESEKENAPEK